jgi:hypothetical protein
VLTAGLELNPERNNLQPLVVAVRTLQPEHQAELNGFPGYVSELFPLEAVDLEVQIVSALLGWVIKLEEHMKR